MKKYPKHRTDVNVRVIDKETIVLDRTKELIHQLNLTASYIWERCDGQLTVVDIARQYMKEFAVSFEVAEADTKKVLDQLQNLGLVEYREDNRSENDEELSTQSKS